MPNSGHRLTAGFVRALFFGGSLGPLDRSPPNNAGRGERRRKVISLLLPIPFAHRQFAGDRIYYIPCVGRQTDPLPSAIIRLRISNCMPLFLCRDVTGIKAASIYYIYKKTKEPFGSVDPSSQARSFQVHSHLYFQWGWMALPFPYRSSTGID